MSTDSKPKTTQPSILIKDIKQRMRAIAAWRDQFNPLRGLTIARVMALRDAFMRGEMADPQWTYQMIERTLPTLMTLVERRQSALGELGWTVSEAQDDTPGFNANLAKEQAAALRETYNGVDNLYEGVKHLGMAKFRGYAHLEIHSDEVGGIHLETLDQWNVVRFGSQNLWRYNPEARSTSYAASDAKLEIDPEAPEWIVRVCPLHIDWIGLAQFVRSNLSNADWDAFVEKFGFDGTFIVGPPNIPEGKEGEYAAQASLAAEGGSGYLPNGTEVKFTNAEKGATPFPEHQRHITEELVLVGTGGLLTMLTSPGSGTLAGNAHAETFAMLARSEAREINELFQKKIDAQVLDQNFPGQKHLAYWGLNVEASTDAVAVVDQAGKLAVAGYRVGVDELGEKTGFTLTEGPIPANAAPLQGGFGGGATGMQEPDLTAEDTEGGEEDPQIPQMDADGKETTAKDTEGLKNRAGKKLYMYGSPQIYAEALKNRATTEAVEGAKGQSEFIASMRDDMMPLYNRLEDIFAVTDPDKQVREIKKLLADMPKLAKAVLSSTSAGEALGKAMAQSVVKGALEATKS